MKSTVCWSSLSITCLRGGGTFIFNKSSALQWEHQMPSHLDNIFLYPYETKNFILKLLKDKGVSEVKACHLTFMFKCIKDMKNRQFSFPNFTNFSLKIAVDYLFLVHNFKTGAFSTIAQLFLVHLCDKSRISFLSYGLGRTFQSHCYI